jgi:hypothetical protein
MSPFLQGESTDSLVRVLQPVPERGFRILRVIYSETVDPVSIVTAYFDDKASGSPVTIFHELRYFERRIDAISRVPVKARLPDSSGYL